MVLGRLRTVKFNVFLLVVLAIVIVIAFVPRILFPDAYPPLQTAIHHKQSGVTGFTFVSEGALDSSLWPASRVIQEAFQSGFKWVRYDGRIYRRARGARGTFSESRKNPPNGFVVSQTNRNILGTRGPARVGLRIVDSTKNELLGEYGGGRSYSNAKFGPATYSHRQLISRTLNPPWAKRRPVPMPNFYPKLGVLTSQTSNLLP